MMLDDRFLKRITLIISVLGILSIFILSGIIEAQNIAVGEITADNIGSKVIVSGIAKDIYWHDSHLFFTLAQNRDEITVVMFESVAKKYPLLANLTNNREVSVMGSVSEYQRELEIVAKEIKIIQN